MKRGYLVQPDQVTIVCGGVTHAVELQFTRALWRLTQSTQKAIAATGYLGTTHHRLVKAWLDDIRDKAHEAYRQEHGVYPWEDDGAHETPVTAILPMKGRGR